MRHLTSHKADGLNDAITIVVVDEPGPGEANHAYTIIVEETNADLPRGKGEFATHIRFQSGPIGEARLNGLSNEALLAVVEDRLIGFQSGPLSCRENALALTKLQECLMWLHKRTQDRMARGVEGTPEH